MDLLMPTVLLKSVLDITPELLHSLGVTAVLLDVDNTLAGDGSQTPFEGTVEWTHHMREQGFQLIILSNNFKERVGPFAEKYGLPFLHFSMKPLPRAYLRAARKLGVLPRDAVVVGDQIFTDVIGANLCRMKSILLTPDKTEGSVSFRIRRLLEKPVRRRAAQTRGPGRFTKYNKE